MPNDIQIFEKLEKSGKLKDYYSHFNHMINLLMISWIKGSGLNNDFNFVMVEGCLRPGPAKQ